MSGKQLIIKISNSWISFNPEYSIYIYHSNIPHKHLSFREKKNIYWRVEMTRYDSETQHLYLKILSYDVPDIKAFKSQIPKREVAYVTFESINFDELVRDLSFYDKGQLKSLQSPAIDSFQPKNISIDLTISISNISFKLGYVSFIKRVPEVGSHVIFKIPNDNILPEFDCIKFWFSRILKTKKLKVNATLTYPYNNETVIGKSEEVNKINTELIDSIKIQRTYGLMKKPSVQNPDKSLFTSDDIFDQFKDESSNIFMQNDLDIVQILTDSGKIRNRKQLEYLSGLKQSTTHKIRYTLYPSFGFLFLVEGIRNNHFVWEMVNSNATYIWSTGKSDTEIRLQYNRVEDAINMIREAGRQNYLRGYKNLHLDDDLIFSRLQHDDISSPLKDSFALWRARLDERLA